MRTVTKRVVPERIVEETSPDIICDICGKTYRNWDGQYHKNETIVRLEEGSYYPEGGSCEKMYVDICPDCFKEKLIPFLKSIAKHEIPHSREVDF